MICEHLKLSPAELGFDVQDPRVVRDIRTCLNVYHTAKGKHDAKNKSDWEKNNPNGVSLLRWARGGETKTRNPLEVRVQLPQRPKK